MLCSALKRGSRRPMMYSSELEQVVPTAFEEDFFVDKKHPVSWSRLFIFFYSPHIQLLQNRILLCLLIILVRCVRVQVVNIQIHVGSCIGISPLINQQLLAFSHFETATPCQLIRLYFHNSARKSVVKKVMEYCDELESQKRD